MHCLDISVFKNRETYLGHVAYYSLRASNIADTKKFDCSQGFKLTDEPREAVAEKEEHPTTNDRLYNLCVTNSILTSLSSPGSD